MPEVPTVDAPTTTQSGAPLNISAPAAAFGASVIADGLQKFGAGFQANSDMLAKHAEEFQAINNKAESDGAFVEQLKAVNQYSANYQANNRGINAYNNLPNAMEDIEKQRSTIAATLSNPMAKAMFDADSRRATANITGELTRFAVTQRKEYVLKQATAAQEALASDTVIHPEQFDANMQQMMQHQLFINDQLGLSEDQGKLEARKLYGSTVAMVSETLAGTGNIEGASAFLEAHKAGMDGKVYAQTIMKLKPAMLANEAASIGHEAVTDALHGMGSSIGPTVDYVSNVHAQEGTGKNPRSSAEGVGQFTSGTWLHLLKNDPSFKADIAGKSDAEILALRDNASVANRAIIQNGQQNADYLHSRGLPVSAATVGMAHNLGPGGAEAILRADPNANAGDVLDAQYAGQHPNQPHAVTAANPNLKNQTVAQVQAGFQSRFGGGSIDSNAGGPPTSMDLQGRMQTVLSLVDSKVQARYGDNAVIRDQAESRAMAELNRQIGAAKDTETSAYTTLGSLAMDQQIQDLPTLLKTVPNGLQMYNTLPLSQRTALQGDIHRNATEVTNSRLNNITELNGRYAQRATNPQAFLSVDIANTDLPLSQKIDFMKKQAELRNKPASQADPNEKILTSVKNSEQYHALTSQLGIASKSDEEYHLLGTLSGQIDAWNAGHPNQPPTPKDISAMLASSAAQHNYHYTVLGHQVPFSGGSAPTYDISDEDRQQAIKLLPKLGRPTDEYNIARLVAEKNARGGK